MKYLSLTPHGQAELVLVNGPPFRPWVVVSYDLGSPLWEHQRSGQRSTLGARSAEGRLGNRAPTFALKGYAASKDVMASDIADLDAAMDALRRDGGKLTLQMHGQTFRQHLVVLATNGLKISEWDRRLDNSHEAKPLLELDCAPYFEGDPMDVVDTFETDSLDAGDYTAHFGALSNLDVVAGEVVPLSSLSTRHVIAHTQRGYQLEDHEVTLEFKVGATLTGFEAGVILKYKSAGTFLVAMIHDTGSGSFLRVSSYINGVEQSVDDLAITRLVVGGTYRVRGRVEGDRFAIEYVGPVAMLDPVGNVITSLSRPLDTSFAGGAFVPGVTGYGGILWKPIEATARLLHFEVLPFTYQKPIWGASCAGEIPGNMPARADVTVLDAHEGQTSTSGWGLIAWAQRPPVFNWLMDANNKGIAAYSSISWRYQAETGVNAASNLNSAVTPGLYVENASGVNAQAVIGSGSHKRIYGIFKANRRYTAVVWVKGTDGRKMRLRVGGSGASGVESPQVTLTASWQRIELAWTPASDQTKAWIALKNDEAVAHIFYFDGVLFYEGTVAPKTGLQVQGAGAYPPFGVIPAANVYSTPTVDATAETGESAELAFAGAGVEASRLLSAGWIEPTLMPADDYSPGQRLIEVWARVKIHKAFTGGVRIRLAALAENGQSTTYTLEHGTVGRMIPIDTAPVGGYWRNTRLGTLAFVADEDGAGRWRLDLTTTILAGTNGQSVALDWLLLVPARARACSPSGRTYDGHPYFTSPQRAKQFRADLSGRLLVPGVPASGLGGSLIELPTGPIAAICRASGIPDNPQIGLESDVGAWPAFHLSVTPRWSFLRDE